MHFLKNWFVNFLCAFFANHVMPGVEAVDQTKLPHLGSDILFPAALGLLNALICPIMRKTDKKLSLFHIAAVVLLINFAVYALVKWLPVGFHILTAEGYLLVALATSVGSFVLNYLDYKRIKQDAPKPPMN
jgi:uncharacterized membrane protein YvlD (DUF360 family)